MGVGGAGDAIARAQIQLWRRGAAIKEGQQRTGGVLDQLLIWSHKEHRDNESLNENKPCYSKSMQLQTGRMCDKKLWSGQLVLVCPCSSEMLYYFFTPFSVVWDVGAPSSLRIQEQQFGCSCSLNWLSTLWPQNSPTLMKSVQIPFWLSNLLFCNYL